MPVNHQLNVGANMTDLMNVSSESSANMMQLKFLNFLKVLLITLKFLCNLFLNIALRKCDTAEL